MRTILLFLITFTYHFQTYSQIQIVSERDKNNVIRFYAENEDNIPYSVIIEFTELRNLTSYAGMKVLAIAHPGKTSIAKLTRNEIKNIDYFRYTTSYHKGDYRSKTKEDILYLIPIAEGSLTTMLPLSHIENRINPEKINGDYVGISYAFDSPTIICAPRKGIISDMKIVEELTGSGYSYSALDNFIEIYHEDGTFTKISVLKSGSAKVKTGDKVYPGTPIAMSAGENYHLGPHVRMVQSRLVLKDNKFEREAFPVKHFLVNFDQEKPYGRKVSVEHPKELITLEMSKKEIKRLLP